MARDGGPQHGYVRRHVVCWPVFLCWILCLFLLLSEMYCIKEVSHFKIFCKIITHRRSIANRGGRFQRHLFVSLFVRQHDDFRTIKRTMMKLGG